MTVVNDNTHILPEILTSLHFTSLHITSLHFTPHFLRPCTFGFFVTTLKKFAFFFQENARYDLA